MKKNILICLVPAFATLVASVTSPAPAQSICRSITRLLPASGAAADSVTLTCQHNFGLVATQGFGSSRVQGATKTLTAKLLQKPAGMSVTTFGVNAAGQNVCSVTDSMVDASSVATTCAAATHWYMQVLYPE